MKTRRLDAVLAELLRKFSNTFKFNVPEKTVKPRRLYTVLTELLRKF